MWNPRGLQYKMNEYFPLLPHGKLQNILPGIYTVQGSMRLFGLFRYSRSMTILCDKKRIGLLNPVRVDEDTLEEIEKIGDINYIFKIGQLHSVDIPFYMDRFSPELWINPSDPFLSKYPDALSFEDEKKIPLLAGKVKVITDSNIAESVIFTPEHGGCLHSCDAFVNMGVDPYHNLLTAFLSRFLPKPTYIGPNWVKIAKPPEDFHKVMPKYPFRKLNPRSRHPNYWRSDGKTRKIH